MVTALVAILLSGHVVLGLGALTVDVGLFYVEREELQSGADAAALAVARVCSTYPAECVAGEMAALAAGYADDNAHDHASSAQVCGQVPGSPDLGPCGGEPTNLTRCLGQRPAAPVPFVEVRTTTPRPSGDTALPPVFSGAITGTDGVTISACARVSWGPVGSASVLPLAVPICRFEGATGRLGLQPPPTGHDDTGGPGFTVTGPEAEIWLDFKPPDGGGCAGGPSNFMPDGFGWLTGVGPDCARTVTVGEWYTGNTVPGTPDGCAERLVNTHAAAEPLPVVVFDRAHEPDHDNEYRVAGIAAFVVTGWRTGPAWPGGPRGDHPPAVHGTHFCPNPDFCVYGYFTSRVIPGGPGIEAGPGQPRFGTAYLKTIG